MTTKEKTQGKLDIKKGDTVLVLAGKDRGKQGRVIQAIPREGKLVVDGVNIVTRHQRARGGTQRMAQQQTGRIQKPAPLFRSKVMLVCPQCNKPTRVGHTITPDGKHLRICKVCKEQITQD